MVIVKMTTHAGILTGDGRRLIPCIARSWIARRPWAGTSQVSCEG